MSNDPWGAGNPAEIAPATFLVGIPVDPSSKK